jgi:HEAT repeat protein
MTLSRTRAVSTNLSSWINALGAADVEQRRQACAALASQQETARSAAISLVNATGDADEQVREWAAAALEKLGIPHESDLAALTDLLKADHPDVGYWSATLLGRLKSVAAPAVEPLAAALADPYPRIVQERAAWALGMLGPAAAPARRALEAAADSSQRRLARLAREALDRIGAAEGKD